VTSLDLKKILEDKKGIKKYKLPARMLEIADAMENEYGKDNEWVFFILGHIDTNTKTFIGDEIAVPEQITSSDDTAIHFNDFPSTHFIIVHKHPCPHILPSKQDLGYLDFAGCCGIVIICGGCITSAYNAEGHRLPLEAVEIY